MQKLAARLAFLALSASCVSVSCWAYYDEYPQKAVRVVVGAPSGDSTDILARLVAFSLAEQFRQPFIVENITGAMGRVAAARVAKAPADGYTLLVVSSSFATSISMYRDLTYHPGRDFAAIARLASVPHVLVVNSALDARSLNDFLGLVRARPGRIAIGSGGTGTTSHLAAELMKMRAGWLNALHVPYRSNGQALAEVLGNHVHAMIATVPSAYPLVRAGRLRALAVASEKRQSRLANVPTFLEAGFPDLKSAAWSGVVAPAGTPYDRVVRLNLAIGEALRSGPMQQRFLVQGAEAAHETHEHFSQYLQSEIEKWAKVVKASGITPR